MPACVEEIKTKIKKVEGVSGKLFSLANNYIDQASKIIEELKELRENKESFATETYIDQVISLHEDILKKVHDSEFQAKKRLREVVKGLEIKREEETKSHQRKQANKKDKPREIRESTLSFKIEEYSQTGAFITHLPQFLSLIDLGVKQYQRKAPQFG